jgi:hypothetical protein
MSGNARRYVETHLDPVKLGEQVWKALTGSDTVAASQEIALCRPD